MGGSSSSSPATVGNAPKSDWRTIDDLIKAQDAASAIGIELGQGINQNAIDSGYSVANTSVGLGRGLTRFSNRMGKELVKSALNARPELRKADLPHLQELAKREAEVNELESNLLESRVNPDVARARAELSHQVAGELEGGPSQELSNLWLKQGLADIIATGAKSNSGFARSALADRTRSDYTVDRDRIQNKAAALLAANPRPTAGIDPGALAQLDIATRGQNADSRDAWRQQVLEALGNQANNVVGGLKSQAENTTGSMANQANTVTQSMKNNAEILMSAADKSVQNRLGAQQQRMQAEAQVRAQNAQAQNAAAGASSANKGAMTGALIGGGAAIGGAVILAF